ncbi:MAG: hypothetical protein ACO2PN_15595 [Pyrobaculum sp.]|jgi:hypothetical protein
MINISAVYQWCMEATGGDAEYCADVKHVAAQATSTRLFSYTHGNTTFHLLLPKTIYVAQVIDEDEEGDTVMLIATKAAYDAKMLLDDQKKAIAVMLQAPNHVVSIVYERGMGKPTLRRTIFTNRELSALINGPLKLPE